MNIRFTQAITCAKIYPCAEFVEAAVRRIRTTEHKITVIRAQAVPGGYVIPVRRHSLNRALEGVAVYDEYIAA